MKIRRILRHGNPKFRQTSELTIGLNLANDSTSDTYSDTNNKDIP